MRTSPYQNQIIEGSHRLQSEKVSSKEKKMPLKRQSSSTKTSILFVVRRKRKSKKMRREAILFKIAGGPNQAHH